MKVKSDMLYLGIDTSCYTTSVALVNSNEEVLYDERIVLDVPKGSCGLRQAEAVFQHNNNLPALIEKCFSFLADSKYKIKSVSASIKPRNIEGSYMPVFICGYNTARIICSSLNIPLNKLSHQENHIISGLWSIGCDFTKDYLVYHISGGTTELIHVKSSINDIEVIGGSKDLHVGQFIDRIGVALGLEFPSGKYMDNLCRPNVSVSNLDLNFPVSVDDCFTSFSGPETYIKKLIKETKYPPYIISYSTFTCVAKSLKRTIISASTKTKCKRILIVGGVASNSVIRHFICNDIDIRRSDIDIVFSNEKYSSDNAVGAALCGRKIDCV